MAGNVSADRLTRELAEQLKNLDRQIRTFFDDGELEVYKAISVSLRVLLRGSSGDAPLVEQVIPDARLHPLRIVPSDPPDDHMTLPAGVVIQNVHVAPGSNVRTLFVEGGAVEQMGFEQDLFDDTQAPIPIAAWRKQPFLRSEWSLIEVLTVVAHKGGGAHFDPTHPKLQAMESWGSFHWHIVACVARSVCPQLVSQLTTMGHVYHRP